MVVPQSGHLAFKAGLPFFMVPLNYEVKDGKGTTFLDFLREENIIPSRMLKLLKGKNRIPVKVLNTFIYSADWKALLLCYKNLKGMMNPSSAQLKSERILNDLQNYDKFPLILSIFNEPTRLLPLLLRSSFHLIYLKTIPTIARRADLSLHGDVRLTNSALFQELILASLENIGLKSKAMNIFEKYGLVSSATKSVSKSNPLSLSHIKIELFHKNRELFLKELK